MCLSSVARIVAVDGDVAVVDGPQGRAEVTLLFMPEPVGPGDAVAVQFGHAVARLRPPDAGLLPSLCPEDREDHP